MPRTVQLPPEVTELDHGPLELPVDEELSRDVGETVEAQPHGCFAAAYQTVMDGVLEDAVYVEGYVLHSELPVPVLHGWVEWLDDRIIDPVYTLYSPNEGRCYFPGIRLRWEQMEELNAAYPDAQLPYSDFCWDHPELYAAVHEAYYAANEHLAPGLGAQIRQMEEQVTRHNREVWARARAAKDAGDVV